MKQPFSKGQRGQKELCEEREARPKGGDGGPFPTAQHVTASWKHPTPVMMSFAVQCYVEPLAGTLTH